MIFNTGESPAELKSRYNPEGSLLRKAQYRMLDMLSYIDAICIQENISYRIDGGTVLGAVRHGGFIPWDDDVDIVVDGKGYDKLKKYLLKHPHPQYVLQTHETDTGYMAGWCVLRDTKSEYVKNDPIHNLRKYRGLQIDIFPQTIGNIYFLKRVSNILCNILINRYIERNCKLASFNWYLLYKVVFPIFSTFNFMGNKELITYSYGIPFCRKDYKTKDCMPYKPILFEGKEFYGPANPEEFLKSEYGNYLDLPPVGNRNTHQAEYKVWD